MKYYSFGLYNGLMHYTNITSVIYSLWFWHVIMNQTMVHSRSHCFKGIPESYKRDINFILSFSASHFVKTESVILYMWPVFNLEDCLHHVEYFIQSKETVWYTSHNKSKPVHYTPTQEVFKRGLDNHICEML